MKQGMKLDNFIEGEVAARTRRLLEQYRLIYPEENIFFWMNIIIIKLDWNHYQLHTI